MDLWISVVLKYIFHVSCLLLIESLLFYAHVFPITGLDCRYASLASRLFGVRLLECKMWLDMVSLKLSPSLKKWNLNGAPNRAITSDCVLMHPHWYIWLRYNNQLLYLCHLLGSLNKKRNTFMLFILINQLVESMRLSSRSPLPSDAKMIQSTCTHLL